MGQNNHEHCLLCVFSFLFLTMNYAQNMNVVRWRERVRNLSYVFKFNTLSVIVFFYITFIINADSL